MDETDQKLLGLLGENARLSVAVLARRLGLARTTVQSRIDRLESRGVIAGYSLRLGQGAQRRRIRATVLLQVEPRNTPAVLQRLRSSPEVELAHTASGRFDLVLRVAAGSTEELDATLDRIGAIPGVRSSESLIHLSTKIDRAG